jgi:hypothetical protein
VSLQKCDDWLSAASAERELRPAEPNDDLFVSILDFLLAAIALCHEHRVKKNLRLRSFQLYDAGLVPLELVFVSAELFGADHVLLLERLDSFHDAI